MRRIATQAHERKGSSPSDPRASAGRSRRRTREARLSLDGAFTPLFLIGLVSIAALRLWQLSEGEAPPGADPGNWLAFAYELTGEQVKAAEAAAPPLVPALLLTLMAIASPLLALKIVAVFAATFTAVPFCGKRDVA